MSTKIIIKTESDKEIDMQKEGWFFADRTLGVSINLSQNKLDLDKLIRLKVIHTTEYKKAILEIAQKSFLYDRRFHLNLYCDMEIAKRELEKWINETSDVMVCLYKDIPVGFLVLKEAEEDTLFVHLCAVDEKYRLTGAAMSLYANAMKFAKEKGYKKLNGRISSQNTAVMNIYSYLGASFSEPEDIFLKDE